MKKILNIIMGILVLIMCVIMIFYYQNPAGNMIMVVLALITCVLYAITDHLK